MQEVYRLAGINVELLEALQETLAAYKRCCIMLKINPSHAVKAEQAISKATNESGGE